MVTVVTADVINFGTGGGSMLEGEVKMVQGMYLPTPKFLYGEGIYHTKTYTTTDTDTWIQTKNNDT